VFINIIFCFNNSLEQLSRESVDTHGFNRVVRENHNRNLSTNEIYRRIESRNAQGKPTYFFRTELYRRTEE